MAKMLDSKDFLGDEIIEGMRFTLGDKEKIKKKEGVEISYGDVRILGGKLKFKERDIVIVTGTKTVKYAGNDGKTYNEVTFQIERNGELLKEGEDIVNYTFNGNLLIHHLFPVSVSDIKHVLEVARQEAKGAVEKVLDKKNRD